MNAENFKTAGGVGDANVNFAVEATETTEGGINGVGPVSRGHNDDVRARLQAIHESEQLGDDTALDLAIRLLTLRGNRVDLVNEDDGR